MIIISRITRSINNIVLVSLASIYIIAGALIIYFANSHMKEQALHEASDRARLLLYRNLAEHDYFSNRLKPRLLEVFFRSKSKDYFDPCWMSSTYAVREMDSELKRNIKEEYYYKEAAINARSTYNEADKYEAGFLEELNSGGKNKEVREIRKINGEKYFSYMIQGETVTEDCLICHGSPGDAPKMLVEMYGDKKSFNRKAGEVISAISIRIPLKDAYAAANNFSARLSIILLLVLFTVLLIYFLIYRRFIHAPIVKIKNKALEIVNSKEHLGEQIPVNYENELGELTKAFNWLSGNMKELLDGLESKVKERTESYEKANLELTHQIQHRLKIEEALKESENRYRQLIEISPNAIGVIEDSKIAFVNSSSLKLLGGDSTDGLIGQDIERFIYPAARKSKIVGLLNTIKQSNKTFTAETKILNLAGDSINVEVFAAPIISRGKRALQFIVHSIEKRRNTEQALKSSEKQFRSVFDNSPIGIAIALKDRVFKANKSFVEMFGYEGSSEIENVSLKSLISNIYQENPEVQNIVWDSERPDNKFYELNGMKKNSSVFPINAGFARINLPEGRAIVAMISDRTELQIREEEVKNSLKEKETLLREIHHRVKNNLQIISSLLNLQMQFIEDEKLRALFNDSCSRVRSMSLIHEKLYQTKSLSKINIREYVLDLTIFLKSAYSRDSQRIEIRTELEEVLLTVDWAVPIGLIINELVSNSLKYAFKDLQEGIIDIRLIKDKERIEITISDNGVGLPENVDLGNPSTLGLQLVSGLAEQIKGTIEISRGKGTRFSVVFSAE